MLARPPSPVGALAHSRGELARRRALARVWLPFVVLVASGCQAVLNFQDFSGDDDDGPTSGSGGASGVGGTGGGGGSGGTSAGQGGGGAGGGGGGGGTGAGGTGGGGPFPQPAPSALIAGGAFTCALRGGTPFCWGANDNEELGRESLGGAKGGYPQPLPVETQAGALTSVIQLAAGEAFACALLMQGGVTLCWGDNVKGQLGDGTTTNPRALPSSLLALIDGQIALGATGVELGGDFGCAVKDNGQVLSWGNSALDVLGRPVDAPSSALLAAPVELGGEPLSGASQVASGASHACAVVGDQAFCWGNNILHQLGRPNTSERAPGPVKDGGGGDLVGVQNVAAGSLHTCALTDESSVLCWGANDEGQIGAGLPEGVASAISPIPVRDTAGVDLSEVSEIALGSQHGCALKGGKAFCWGSNGQGQLGNGAFSGKSSPVARPVVTSDGSPLDGVEHIVAGGKHTCALLEGGRVFCWGSNAKGQLGTPTNIGTETANPVPTEVPGLLPP